MPLCVQAINTGRHKAGTHMHTYKWARMHDGTTTRVCKLDPHTCAHAHPPQVAQATHMLQLLHDSKGHLP